MKHKAATMRAQGWRNATTLDALDLVIGRRYLVTNGKRVEVGICNETLEGTLFWDQADTTADTLLGEARQWPWWKEEEER